MGQPSPPGLTTDPVSPIRVRSKQSDGFSPARTVSVRPDSRHVRPRSDKATETASAKLSPAGLAESDPDSADRKTASAFLFRFSQIQFRSSVLIILNY